MATSGFFKSPAALVGNDSSILSSSPDLPPLSELMQRGPKKCMVQSGSQAVAKSGNAAVPSLSSTSGATKSTLVFAEKDPTLDVVAKGTASAPAALESGPSKKKAARPRQPRAPARSKKTAASAGDVDGGAEPSDGHAKLPRRKVTKPAAMKNAKAETKSKFFSSAVQSGLATEPIEIEMDDCFEAEPALKRRTDWTPPVETKHQQVSVEPSSPTVDKDVFKKLQHSYACVLPGDQGRAVSGATGPDVFGKRKLMELVATGEGSGSKRQEASPTKVKAPKKKARTITELAVAAYRVPEPTTDAGADASQDSLLQYFDVDKPTVQVKAKKTASTSRVTKKKAAPKKPVLLSPTSALRQVSAQDFVFGTSSQLATEQDAEFLRAVQKAMLLSNRDDNPFDDDAPAAKAPGKKLWGAGARDEDGDLHHVEVIDLVEAIDVVDEPPLDYDKMAKAVTEAVPVPDSEPPPSNQEHNRLLTQSQSQSQSQPQLARPDYELFTDARLAKEVDANGFKPVKRRAAMIALLNECWEAKTSAAVGMQKVSTLPAKKKTSTAAPKPRGRPKKTSTADEPAAPKPDTAAARQRASAKKTTDLSDLSSADSDSVHEEDAAELSLLAPASPSTEQATLFSFITLAVTTAPPSADPTKPSWHEKMLMYDPVILEDLAAWLNAGQLDRVGWDGEVAPAEVKKWCEGRSLCCMWRVNIHGRERKRV